MFFTLALRLAVIFASFSYFFLLVSHRGQHLWIQFSQLRPWISGRQPKVGLNTDHNHHRYYKTQAVRQLKHSAFADAVVCNKKEKTPQLINKHIILHVVYQWYLQKIIRSLNCLTVWTNWKPDFFISGSLPTVNRFSRLNHWILGSAKSAVWKRWSILITSFLGA